LKKPPILWKLTAREMQRRPGRSLLTLLGIVIGVAAAVAVSVTLQATRHAHREMFQTVAGRAALEVVEQGLGKFHPRDVDDLRSVPGIQAGVSTVQVPAVLSGTKGAVPLLVLGIDPEGDAQARDYTLRVGHSLREKDGILLEAGFAEANGIRLGDKPALLTREGAADLPLVGLLEPTGPAAFNGGAVTFLRLATAQRLFGFADRINSFQIVLADDAGLEQVEAEVHRRLRPGLTVREPSTRGALGRETMMSSEQGLAALSVSSLVAGAFLILNAFLMSLGERRRQLAILRAVGATRAQVTRLLLREAVLLGLAGSVLGLGLGFLLSIGLRAVMASMLVVTLPALRSNLEPFVIAFVLGPGIALLAAYVPARRAARRSPLPDLLQAHGDRSEPPRRWLSYLGVAIVALVIALALAVVWRVIPSWLALPFLAPVMALFLVGCVLVLPLILTPLLRLALWLLKPVLRTEAVIAVRHLERNRGRTTLTAGVLLVAVIFALGFGQSFVNNLRDIHAWIDRIGTFDFFLRKVWLDPTITITTAALPDRLEEIDDSRLVERIDKASFLPGRAGGQDVAILACTYSPDRPPALALTAGEPHDVARRLVGGEVVIGTALAQRLGLGVGDEIALETRHGLRKLRIAGTATEYTGGGNAVYIEWSHAARLFDMPGVHVYLITARPGQVAALGALLKDYCARRSYILQSHADFREAFDRQIKGFLAFVWALLALVFVVASLGIVNTLTMNVLEQTRELGTLRAVGMKRGQMRKLILAQALALAATSLVPGAVGGIALAFLMNLMTYPLTGQPVAFHLDFWLVAGCFLVAVTIVVLAAHFPGRRAAGLQVIQALQYE
jgi:putative ABC transport system permease protein